MEKENSKSVYLDDECVVGLGEHGWIVVDVRDVNVDFGCAKTSRTPVIRRPDSQSVTRHLHTHSITMRKKNLKNSNDNC